MADINESQIRDLEDELNKLSKIELGFESPNSTANALIASKLTKPKNLKKTELNKILNELDVIIKSLSDKAGTRGNVMSKKAMDKYLEKSERIARSQRTIDAIKRANNKRKLRRLGLYVEELAKEKNILLSDVKLYKQRGAIAGFSQKEILSQLARETIEGTGPVQSFKKRFQTLEKAVLRREASSREIEQYRLEAKPDELWQWITISVRPCPDCQGRAGVTLTWEQWEKLGLPGEGRTICQSYCMCKLYPVSISEELYPKVKTFTWNKDKGVLTTAKEARTLTAKKNQPKQKTTKRN